MSLFKGDRSFRYNLYGWRHLFTRSSVAPLLPNLQSLTFDASSTATQFEQIAWFSLFLSPSLCELELSVSFWDSYTSPSAATLLFSALVASLPWPPSTYSLPFSERLLSVTNEGEYTKGYDWFRNTPNLTGLRQLAISVFVIRAEELYILGLLPMLESIELIFGSDELVFFFPELVQDLPTNAFPQLRHLSLIDLPNISAFHDLWNLDGIVSKLASVKIQLNKYLWMSPLPPSQIIQDFVPVISEQSPEVSELMIQLPSYETSPGDKSSSSAPMFELLSRLPLQRLRYTSLTPFHLCLAHHRTHYPLLHRLELTTAWVDPFDLRALAEIVPNLEYLGVNITIRPEHCEIVRSESFTAPQPITISIMSVYIENDSGWDQHAHGNNIESVLLTFLVCYYKLTHMVSFLKVLWPDARYIISQTAKDTLSHHKLTII